MSGAASGAAELRQAGAGLRPGRRVLASASCLRTRAKGVTVRRVAGCEGAVWAVGGVDVVTVGLR